MRDYTLYLKDILTIESIEVFTAEEEIRLKHPEIPWKQIAGMRDKLVHFYFGVDAHLIWQTILNRLPALKTAIKMRLRD